MAGDPILDPDAQQQFVAGLPPVLPSLSKPKAPASAPGPLTMGMPATALPPVTSLDPTPGQQGVARAKSALEDAQAKPSFTAGLWERTKGADSVLGKIGHVGAGILRGVDIAGEIAAPNIARNIPGTGLNRWQGIQQAQAGVQMAEANAKTEAETARDWAEAGKNRFESQPKPTPTKYGVLTGAQGPNNEPVVYQEEGPEAGTAKAVTGFDVKPTPQKEGEQPITAEDAQRNWDMWSKLNPEVAKKLGNNNPWRPGMTQNEAKQVETTLNASVGKEQGQTHITIDQTKLSDAEEKAAQSAAQGLSMGRMNLYAQKKYAQDYAAWQQAVQGPQYAKDVTLMTNVINGELQQRGVLGGVASNTPIGMLFGGEANPVAAFGIGAVVNTLTNILNGPASAALDSLQKQGISQQGYAAMQAYLTALPARMAFEMSSQGLKASAMRFGKLLEATMKTIPPPNTPAASFQDSFQKYYQPMVVTQRGNEQLQKKLPAGYTLPTYEQYYGTGQ